MYPAGAAGFAEMYKAKEAVSRSQALQRQREEAPAPSNIHNSFEDPMQMYGSAPPPQAPPAGNYYGGPAPTAYAPPAPASASPYGDYAPPAPSAPASAPVSNPYGQAYAPSPYANTYNQAPAPSPYAAPAPPQAAAPNPYGYTPAAPSPYGQQIAPPPQSYAPAPPPPMSMYQPPQEGLRATAIVMHSNNTNTKFFDHPSIPRLTPEAVEEDLKQAAPAPAHITPVRRVSVRPTMGVFAATPQLTDTIGLPMGLHLHPFAETKVNEVDLSDKGDRMVRCRKCAAYINPFTTFVENGRRWQCILCKQMNEPHPKYMCSIDPATGQRQDIMSRPELLHATVDFYPTPEFLRRPPRRPIFLLLLDCSYSAVSTGLLQSMCRGALDALETLKAEENINMCIMGYDSTVYFFNLSTALSAPRMMACPDTVNAISNVNDNFKLEPVELPCPVGDVVVPVSECYEKLRSLLEGLPTMLAHTREVGCAFGPAMAAAITVLEANGGKILASITNIPSDGEGKLKHRFDTNKLSNQPKEYTMCAAANDWYKQRALACSNSSISIDLYAGSNADLDLTTVAPLCRFTSGNIFRATAITMKGIAQQVRRTLERFTAFDSILRVRTSKGLIVPNFYGHCHVREPDLLALPIADQDSAYSVEFKIGPDFKGSFGYVQFAIVYTNRARERRIRVHTVQIPVSSSIAPIMSSINSIGMATFLTKMCVDLATTAPFTDAQNRITDKLVAALREARKHMPASARGDLVIPESMQYIPHLLCGFWRAPATGPATVRCIPPDERVASMSSIMSSSPESVLSQYVAWCYEVYTPSVEVAAMPRLIFSSQSYFNSSGIFLVNIGQALILWVGKRSSRRALQALGYNTAEGSAGQEGEDASCTASAEELDALRTRVEALVATHMEMNAPSFSSVVEVCHQGNSALEPTLTRMMMEDTVRQLASYSDYLKTISAKMSAEKK